MASLCCSRRLCKQCQRHQMFLPVHFACSLASVRRQTIYRWMNQGSIHWVDLSTGHRLVCLHSLIEAHEINPRFIKVVVRNERLLKSLEAS